MSTSDVYEVIARRDGRWWTFEIPELRSPSPVGSGREIVAMGQARRASQVELAALEIVAMWTGEDDAQVTVRFPVPADVEDAIRRAGERDAEARRAEREAVEARRYAASALVTGEHMTQEDAATVLGVSRQRVGQLVA